MKKMITSVLLWLVFTGTASALEVAGEHLPETLAQQNGEPLQLNGAGVRSKFFMDLYVGALYLPHTASTIEQVLQQPAAAIRLKIISGLITAEKMRAAVEEGFEDATDGKTAPIANEIQQFTALFAEQINLGDEFVFLTDNQQGVTVYKNGTAVATIQGEAFRQALLQIWLGETPAQTSLKEAMLGSH